MLNSIFDLVVVTGGFVPRSPSVVSFGTCRQRRSVVSDRARTIRGRACFREGEENNDRPNTERRSAPGTQPPRPAPVQRCRQRTDREIPGRPRRGGLRRPRRTAWTDGPVRLPPRPGACPRRGGRL